MNPTLKKVLWGAAWVILAVALGVGVVAGYRAIKAGALEDAIAATQAKLVSEKEYGAPIAPTSAETELQELRAKVAAGAEAEKQRAAAEKLAAEKKAAEEKLAAETKKVADEKAALEARLKRIEELLVEAAKPKASTSTFAGGPVPRGIDPATHGAFRPVSPDKRFLQVPNPEIANGNADGSIALQWTDDLGVICPRPAGPSYSKEQLVEAAERAGLAAMALENQNTSLDKFVLADWPSTEPVIGSDGRQVVISGVPQVVMYKVLRSPNVTAIRHKDDVPGTVRPPAPLPRQSSTGAPNAQVATAGRLMPSGKPGECPFCHIKSSNAPVRPYTCPECKNLVQ